MERDFLEVETPM